MSREVTGNAHADEAEEARTAARRVALRRVGIAAVVVVVAVGFVVRVVVSQQGRGQDGAQRPAPSRSAAVHELRATLTSDGRVEGLDHLQAALTLTNDGPDDVTLVDVAVLGLGTTLFLGATGGGTAQSAGLLARGAARTLPLAVIPDCSARLSPAVRVVATVRDGDEITSVPAVTAPQADLLALLDPVCPPPPSEALAVAISGVQDNGDGSLAVRLVNIGRLHARVVTLAAPDATPAKLDLDPAEPVPLSPGQAVVVTLRVRVPDCAVPDPAPAARALSLEARTEFGFTQVAGWPEAAVQRLLEARAVDCARHET